MLSRKKSAAVAQLVVITFVLMQSAACFSEHIEMTGLGDPCPIPQGAQGPNTAVINARGYDFFPDTLRVAPNTRVVWINCDQAAGSNDPHTSTSDTPGLWSSGNFAEGQTFERVFTSNGSFPYHCIPHPSMTGVVIVQ
jgi:plastocyanin